MNDIYSLTVRSHIFCSRSTLISSPPSLAYGVELLDDWCQGNYSATEISVG